MTADDQGRPGDDQWLTLTDAAERCGHTREALRQRVRRGTLRATKGNDGQLRVQARDVDDLPPVVASADEVTSNPDATLDVLISSMVDLRTDLERTRTALDIALSDRLADHGRAERAEAQAKAEAARAAVAEARLTVAEAALIEARQPWIIRLIWALRLQR